MVVEPLCLAPGHGHAEVQKTHNYNCPLDKAVRSPHNERLGSSPLSLPLFTMNLLLFPTLNHYSVGHKSNIKKTVDSFATLVHVPVGLGVGAKFG